MHNQEHQTISPESDKPQVQCACDVCSRRSRVSWPEWNKKPLQVLSVILTVWNYFGILTRPTNSLYKVRNLKKKVKSVPPKKVLRCQHKSLHPVSDKRRDKNERESLWIWCQSCNVCTSPYSGTHIKPEVSPNNQANIPFAWHVLVCQV